VKRPQWLFMVYLSADNNLELAGVDDFYNEMWQARNNDEVSICVLFDRHPNSNEGDGYTAQWNDWSDTRFYRISRDTRIWSHLGSSERNMGNPQTLQDFVSSCRGYIDADNEALVIWDHGGGWGPRDVGIDEPETDDLYIEPSPAKPTKGAGWDESSGNDYLTTEELRSALTSIEQYGGQPELLGFDACLMSMLEVAYDLRSHYEVMVASEETEPGDGWPYDRVLPQIGSSTNTEQLSTLIVDEYHDFSTSNKTLAAIRSSKVANVAEKLSVLADELIDLVPEYQSEIAAARVASQSFDWGYRDLYDLADEIGSRIPAATAAANEVKGAIGSAGATNSLLVAEAHQSSYPGAHGISIYFHGSTSDWHGGENLYNNYMNQGSNPANLLFVADKHWDEFLRVYFDSDDPSCEVRLC